MTEYVFVKPAFEGGRIRMPDRNSTVMPAEGQLVPRINFYERLLLAGDLVEADAPKEAKEAAAPIADAHAFDRFYAPSSSGSFPAHLTPRAYSPRHSSS
jgi:hypothetical protein